MKKDIHNTYKKILKRKVVDDIIPFLRDLTPEQREELRKTIFEQDRYYYGEIETKEGNWTSYSYRGTHEQFLILGLSKFVCYNDKGKYKIGSPYWSYKYIEKIFEFYIPEWFSSNLQKNLNSNEWSKPYSMDYSFMMKLKNMGLHEPSDSLIRDLLPWHLLSRNDDDENNFTSFRDNENLLIHPETLKEHIWLMFTDQSDIHHCQAWDKNEGKKVWIIALKELSDEGHISRNRLLKETLKTTGNNFDKPLSQWFINLFEFLEPTPDELFSLWTDLLNVFNSPISKGPNLILKYFKKLVTDKRFKLNEFLDYCPILLSSETKGIVTSTLMILEKLAKKHPRKSSEICMASSNALMNKDASIQERTAKIINKYGKHDDSELIDTVAVFKPELRASSLELLNPFFEQIEEEDTDDINFQTPEFIPEPLVYPETLDDFFFLVSEVLENRSVQNNELLLQSMIAMQNKVNSSNIDRLEPALQKAYKQVLGIGVFTFGTLDHLIATIVINYCDFLVKKYPSEGESLKTIRRIYLNKQEQMSQEIPGWENRILKLKKWYTREEYNSAYRPLWERSVFVLDQLYANVDLPILSIPTHFPSRIQPKTLVDRIAKWQQNKSTPNRADLQIAISRCAFREFPEQVSTEGLSGEIKYIMEFLLNDQPPSSTIKDKNLWWVAAVTKNALEIPEELRKLSFNNIAQPNYTGEYSYVFRIKKSTTQDWSVEKGKMVDVPIEIETMTLFMPEAEMIKDSRIKLIKQKKSKHAPLYEHDLQLYHNVLAKKMNYTQPESDIEWIFSMVPNNPEPLLSSVIWSSLKDNYYLGEVDKRYHLKIINLLLNISTQYGKMSHLLLASNMIREDKTIRTLAGEVWIQAVTNQQINNTLFGKMIGKHFAAEFVPVKRFTDLIENSLFGVSVQHNNELITLIENCLLQLSAKPPTGIKKVLESYNELLHKEKKQVPQEVNAILSNWTEINTLKKILKSLQQI